MPTVNVSSIFRYLNPYLPLFLEEQLPNMSPKHQNLLATLEFLELDKRLQDRIYAGVGRRPYSHIPVARAFFAKSIMQIQDTKHLWHALRTDGNLRRICGWDRVCDVPSESTLSRVFARLTATKELVILHEALTSRQYQDTVACHTAIDSTDIKAREKPAPKEKPVEKPKSKRRGRRRKDEQAAPEQASTRIQRQVTMDWEEAVAELPTYCSRGVKRNSNGYITCWNGYKLHVAVSDEGIPLGSFTTSAHVHDSQVAIPLMKKVSEQVTSFYDLADAAYDSKDIKEVSIQLGHVPIIDKIIRRGKRPEVEPDRARRYQTRTTVERFFSQLKDNYGGRNIRVRGPMKIHTHLMFGVLSIFAHAALHIPD